MTCTTEDRRITEVAQRKGEYVARDTGSMGANDEHLLFLCATSVILLSSVVKNTARTGTTNARRMKDEKR
jgi:hypothetical protein